VPELPDITVYVEALRPRVVGARLARIVVKSPFLVRSVEPPIEAVEGRRVVGVARLAKRIVLELEPDDHGPPLFLVFHLMIAGRLLWKPQDALPRGRIDLAAFGFQPDPGGIAGTLVMTEASTKKRASMHIVAGREGLHAHDPGGVEVLACSVREFSAALTRANRTLKRTLTDPRTLSGIGNAYSDEILHAARLSPVKRTGSLTAEEVARLHEACRATLERWTNTLREQFALVKGSPGRFPGPGDITAFRPDFAVHGRYRMPCPVCGTAVQRIVYAENEANYCPRCQTGGKMLADRSLSRLLKSDWPKTAEEWEGKP
jgi:formamidopyrimidine-DNA glycosylase